MHRPLGELEQMLKDSPFPKFMPHTHTDFESLLRDLKTCRERGWTADNEEFEPNVPCVVAPIFDYRGAVVAAVSAVWSTVNALTFKRIAPHVLEAAHQISLRLGFTA